MMYEKHANAIATLKEIFLDWKVDSQSSLDSYIIELIDAGWTRGEIYELLMSLEKFDMKISGEANDYIDDIIASIRGYCSFESMIKFPGESSDKEALLKYVRGNAWRNNA